MFLKKVLKKIKLLEFVEKIDLKFSYYYNQ